MTFYHCLRLNSLFSSFMKRIFDSHQIVDTVTGLTTQYSPQVVYAIIRVIFYLLGVQKLFNSGAFYFAQSIAGSPPFDLTLCAQRRLQDHETDNRFFWFVIDVLLLPCFLKICFLTINSYCVKVISVYYSGHLFYSFSNVWSEQTYNDFGFCIVYCNSEI